VFYGLEQGMFLGFIVHNLFIKLQRHELFYQSSEVNHKLDYTQWRKIFFFGKRYPVGNLLVVAFS